MQKNLYLSVIMIFLFQNFAFGQKNIQILANKLAIQVCEVAKKNPNLAIEELYDIKYYESFYNKEITLVWLAGMELNIESGNKKADPETMVKLGDKCFNLICDTMMYCSQYVQLYEKQKNKTAIEIGFTKENIDVYIDSFKEKITKPDDKEQIPILYKTIGFAYDFKGDYKNAMVNYQKSLVLSPSYFTKTLFLISRNKVKK